MTKRYLLLTVGLIVAAVGVSMVVRSSLGTSPISSWAYVCSLNTPLTVGTYTMILNTILIIGQILLLGRRDTMEHKVELLLQFPVSVVFSVAIDVSMVMLQGVIPDVYAWKVAGTVAGSAITALGIALQVKADVSMNSGEYFVQVLSRKIQRPFGSVKIGFDVALVIIAVITSLLFSGRIDGVREGTVIVALLTGPLVRLISPRLSTLDGTLGFVHAEEAPVTQHDTERPVIITIAREYGSGGRHIGQLVAQHLGLPFYDNQLITMVAQESGYSEQYVSEKEQNIPTSQLLQMIYSDYGMPANKMLSPDDALFVAQSKVMLQLAQQGPCVIMGRCADYILRNDAQCLRVFLHASQDYKVARTASEDHLTTAQAQQRVTLMNRARKNHYYHYTGRTWDDARNYHLAIDTSSMTVDQVCLLIEQTYQLRQLRQPASQQ